MKFLDRSATVMFCDDIRDEKSGMKTIVGIYSFEMRVDSFPYQFPKLCAYLQFLYSVENPIKSFSLKIKSGDDLIIEHPATIDFVDDSLKKTMEEGRGTSAMFTSVELRAVDIDEPCTLIAIVEIDGVEYEANRLKIAQAVDTDISENQRLLAKAK